MKNSDWILIDTLYQFASITKTADRLYTTQPSLTRRLQGIENELGITIAERTPKGLVFTPQGRMLAEKAREYMTWYEETLSGIRALKPQHGGIITAAMSHSFLRYYFSKILIKYKKLYPEITLRVIPGASSDVLHRINNREADIGFIRGIHPFDGNRKKLKTDYGYIIAKEKLNLADLPALPFLDYERDSFTKQKITHWWESHFPNTPMQTQMVKEYDVCLQMVSMGQGFGIIFADESELEPLRLQTEKMFDQSGELITHTTWVIWNEDSSNALLDSILTLL